VISPLHFLIHEPFLRNHHQSSSSPYMPLKCLTILMIDLVRQWTLTSEITRSLNHSKAQHIQASLAIKACHIFVLLMVGLATPMKSHPC
jgi:hypothetical protein